MDTLDMGRFNNPDLNKPIPFDDSGPSESGVSHAPLELGGSAVSIPKPTAPKPAAKPAAPPAKVAPSPPAAANRTPQVAASTGRIEGVKTFFTKLHPGAIEFVDGQITRWLKENPNVIVKRTNIVVGEVQAKKTEPNIIISVWY
jgi:hypothetical protein